MAFLGCRGGVGYGTLFSTADLHRFDPNRRSPRSGIRNSASLEYLRVRGRSKLFWQRGLTQPVNQLCFAYDKEAIVGYSGRILLVTTPHFRYRTAGVRMAAGLRRGEGYSDIGKNCERCQRLTNPAVLCGGAQRAEGRVGTAEPRN
jgi:hypothetical protein